MKGFLEYLLNEGVAGVRQLLVAHQSLCLWGHSLRFTDNTNNVNFSIIFIFSDKSQLVYTLGIRFLAPSPSRD